MRNVLKEFIFEVCIILVNDHGSLRSRKIGMNAVKASMPILVYKQSEMLAW